MYEPGGEIAARSIWGGKSGGGGDADVKGFIKMQTNVTHAQGDNNNLCQNTLKIVQKRRNSIFLFYFWLFL